MPVTRISCDFYYEGTTFYVKFPATSLTELAEAFNDGAGHEGKILLVLDRKRKVFEVVTGSSFDVLNQKLKP